MTLCPPGAVLKNLLRKEYLAMTDARNEQPVALITDERGAAEYLALKPATLRAWRCRGIGPRYVVLGARAIRYTYADLGRWVAEQTHVDPVAAAA
ncbi:helix-turn-helix transcriptional regulator [Brachybacterium alimentarium]|uniref:helix-turn-helix transcriptional regulator n=1 Tax=Brachybacterium alimentarium TaxID=47845 RepID=UPI003FD42C79